MEGCQVRRMGRVAAIISPLPKQLVWLVDEGGVLDSKPELQVLPNLSDAKDALNVPGPAVAG